MAVSYTHLFDPEYEDLMTATSCFTGKKINRFTHVHQSTEDLVKKVKICLLYTSSSKRMIRNNPP